jgi:hypothetical protein
LLRNAQKPSDTHKVQASLGWSYAPLYGEKNLSADVIVATVCQILEIFEWTRQVWPLASWGLCPMGEMTRNK